MTTDRDVEVEDLSLFETIELSGPNHLLHKGRWRRGNIQFELTNHLSNVMVTVSDRKHGIVGETELCDDGYYFTCYYPFVRYKTEVITAHDYYPLGMGMVGRKWSADGTYRYGFNGKENDDDVKGEGNQQDYGMRIYDPRLGRFLSVDPLTRDFPALTIGCVDIDGLEGVDYTKNIIKTSKGETLFQQSNSSNTASIPITADITVSVAGHYRRISAEIKHGNKTINFSPYNAPDAIDIAINPGFYFALNRDAFSKKLLGFTDNELPKIMKNAGIKESSVNAGFINTFRHQAWQSIIAIVLGENTAKRVGDYHERDGILNTQNAEFIKDNIIDLINNEYGRDYAKGFKYSDIKKDIGSFTDYLNGQVQHLAKTVDGIKDDKEYDDLRSGKTKLFDPENQKVKEIFETVKKLDSIL